MRALLLAVLMAAACTPETVVSDLQRINAPTGGACSDTSECQSGHECTDGVCLRRNGQACDEAGECISEICDNGVCVETATGNVDTGGACLTTPDCRAGNVCSDFICLRILGEACTNEDQCDSGFCTDAVCCGSACDGQCDAGCGAGGVCYPVTDGTDCDDGDDCSSGETCVGGACGTGDVDMTCLGTAFADVSASAGVRGVPNTSNEWGSSYGVAWADYDGDGDLDLWRGGNGPDDSLGDPLYQGLLYQNDGDGTFTRVLSAPQGVRAGYWGDPDNDGDLDLFTTSGLDLPPGDVTGAGRLWVNDGSGGFSPASDSIGLGGAINLGNSVWLDANGDGWADLFFPNGNDILSADPGPNQIRLNDGSPTLSFTIYVDAGLATNESNGEVCTAADVDNDGDIDIWYNAEEVGSLYINDGGTFREGAAAAGLAIDLGVGTADYEQPYYVAVFGDYDNDGWLDLFLGHRDGVANRLYTNETDTAGNISFALETTPELLAIDLGHSRGADWGDFDNDGDLDLVVGNEQAGATGAEPAANALFENRGVGGFVNVAADVGLDAAGAARTGSVTFADYDNDGDLDIFVANIQAPSVLWRNELDDDKYLAVRVVGRGGGFSSRDGIGTRVELWDEAGSELLAVREISGGGGYGSHPPAMQHFGLAAAWGGAAATYTVTARFLSGQVRTVTVVPSQAELVVGATTWANAIEIAE